MKAVATCPKCRKKLATDCRECIKAGIDNHLCKGMKKPGIVEGIKWKKLAESEEELNG